VDVLHQGTGQSVKNIFNWGGMLNPLFKRRSCVKVSQPLPPKKKQKKKKNKKQTNQKNVLKCKCLTGNEITASNKINQVI
jgi:hypothetical protein